MKPTEQVALATWMLKHFTFGPRNEALLGDLVEEFRGGRSVGWYWRQVVCAIGVGILSKARGYALPLVFSMGWSMLYPVWWLCVVKVLLTRSVFERWAAIDWPYSTALQGIGKIIPAVLFVWLGLFVYLMLRTEEVHKVSKLRLLGSLSISFNVLFVTTIGLSMHLKSLGDRLGYVTRESLSFNFHLIALSIPLTLGLLSAMLFALSSAQRRRHGSDSVAG